MNDFSKQKKGSISGRGCDLDVCTEGQGRGILEGSHPPNPFGGILEQCGGGHGLHCMCVSIKYLVP